MLKSSGGLGWAAEEGAATAKLVEARRRRRSGGEADPIIEA